MATASISSIDRATMATRRENKLEKDDEANRRKIHPR